MSLYSMLHGKNNKNELLLDILKINIDDIERYRDCYLEEKDNDVKIAIHTRTGGDNRKDYHNYNLTHHHLYDSDEDADYDCTYATYYFNIPAEYKKELEDAYNDKQI